MPTLKILVLRFSSIGDIVLTSPVYRCLYEQKEGVSIHLLTKSKFATIMEFNPYIDKIWTFEKKINEVVSELKKEKYNLIIDLHNNLRTRELSFKLGITVHRFNKLNIQKWLKVNTPWDLLPKEHIVERYLRTINHLGVYNDFKGLDYFLPPTIEKKFPIKIPSSFVAIALGASYQTKVIPFEKIDKIIRKLNTTIILLGGPNDKKTATKLKEKHPQIINSVGKTNLHQSAYLVKKANVIITPDTGLMHIAAAFQTPTISIWGNTVPEFGMFPYMPKQPDNFEVIQVNNLKCRPCSKIGYQECPKKHFRCMNDIDVDEVVNKVSGYLS